MYLKKLGLIAVLTATLIAGPMPRIETSKSAEQLEDVLNLTPANAPANKEEIVKADTTPANYPPWKNTIRKTKEMDQNLREEIKQQLQKKWGVRPRAYFGFMDEEREEDLVKWVYEAAETASQNTYGIKVTPSEIFTMFMLEGGAKPGSILSENYELGYYKYKEKYDLQVSGWSELGLDFISSEIAALKKAGFIPYSIKLLPYSYNSYLFQSKNEHGVRMQTASFSSLEDGLKALAGTLAERKCIFLQDFKKYFGKAELNKLTDEETFFWAAFYFNAGKGCGKGELTGKLYTNGRGLKQQGKGRGKTYKPLEYAESTTNCNPRVNALIKLATKQWIDSFRLFDHP